MGRANGNEASGRSPRSPLILSARFDTAIAIFLSSECEVFWLPRSFGARAVTLNDIDGHVQAGRPEPQLRSSNLFLSSLHTSTNLISSRTSMMDSEWRLGVPEGESTMSNDPVPRLSLLSLQSSYDSRVFPIPPV